MWLVTHLLSVLAEGSCCLLGDWGQYSLHGQFSSERGPVTRLGSEVIHVAPEVVQDLPLGRGQLACNDPDPKRKSSVSLWLT